MIHDKVKCMIPKEKKIRQQFTGFKNVAATKLHSIYTTFFKNIIIFFFLYIVGHVGMYAFKIL